MRLALPLIALLLTSGAAAEPTPQLAPPKVRAPVPNSAATGADEGVICRDRIHQVREQRGLPELQRDPASPDEPLLIAAVDHRIDGCSVMVMYGNTSDVRPLPALPDGPPRLQRIPAPQ